MHPRIVAARPKPGLTLELTFADGSRGSVDLSPWIVGSTGVFAALGDPGVFEQVTVDRDAGTVVWPNGADLDPDVLYELARQARSSR
jgi:Protein of unknown function (DUF2442)